MLPGGTDNLEPQEQPLPSTVVNPERHPFTQLAAHYQGRRHKEVIRRQTEGPQHCKLCEREFTCKRQLNIHLGGKDHRRALVREEKRRERAILQRAAEEIEEIDRLEDAKTQALADIRRKKKGLRERQLREAGFDI